MAVLTIVARYWQVLVGGLAAFGMLIYGQRRRAAERTQFHAEALAGEMQGGGAMLETRRLLENLYTQGGAAGGDPA
jgi:hypothetical protein